MATDRRRVMYGRPDLGLLIVVALAIFGAVILVLAEMFEDRGWTVGAYVVGTLALLGLYLREVVLPHREALRHHREMTESSQTLQRGLEAVLDDLRSGDLVEIDHDLGELPHRLAAAVRASSRSLAAQISQIQRSSVEVAAAANAVQETASELASGSSEQAAAVVQITATMEELARTAGQIAANAADQARSAASAEASGDSGASAVEGSVDGVERIRTRMVRIAERADVLGARSREIYRVLDLITEIAQETHILSLNAAIEASAAGEHGERFAVVAAEVRRLAHRSRESVDSVRELLKEFSSAIQATVVATEEGTKETEALLTEVRSAATAIESLRGAISTAASMAKQISLATEEQETASDQVALTLKEVSEVVQRMADGLKRFSGAADELNRLALSIQLLTQSFRLRSPHSLKDLALGWADQLGERSRNWEALEQQLGRFLEEGQFLELIYVVDTDGNMVAVDSNYELGEGPTEDDAIAAGRNFADRPWFQGVMRDRRTVLTSLYRSVLTGDDCFTVATPIEDADERTVGVLGMDVNVRSWTKI